MSASCPERSILDRFDALPGERRREVLVHASACSQCRTALIDGDPSRLFGLLAFEPIPAAALDAVSDAVSRRIGSAPAPRRSWVPVAGWAAAALLAVLAARTLREPLRPMDIAADETAALRGPRAGVEFLSPADPGQVVDLTVGDSQVVMIFDERVKL